MTGRSDKNGSEGGADGPVRRGVKFSQSAARLRGEINTLYRERDAILTRGWSITDLVSGNVNAHGLSFPQDALHDILKRAYDAAQTYKPDPLGQREAREAIRSAYRESGFNVSADHILLTPGTSVSYAYAFRLFANAGDEILCPRPSYPLFDPIAEFAGVRVSTYRLDEGRGWAIDLEHLEAQISARTRAVVLISPHNPTGMIADVDQVGALSEIVRRHHLPVISDEVFSPFIDDDFLPRIARTAAPLVLTLNGFSKMFALPGMKIGWIAVTGDRDLVRTAMASLETMSDMFLPVGEIAQFAVAGIFRRGKTFLADYVSEMRRRREAAVAALAASPHLQVVPPRGGFYVTARIVGDGREDEEEIALDLLRRYGILVHPGFYYDIEPPHLVMTFVPPIETFKESLDRVTYFLSEKFKGTIGG